MFDERKQRNGYRVIRTERGEFFELDLMAIRELQRVKNAADANCIFDRFAPDVPLSRRCDVWLAIEGIV